MPDVTIASRRPRLHVPPPLGSHAPRSRCLCPRDGRCMSHPWHGRLGVAVTLLEPKPSAYKYHSHHGASRAPCSHHRTLHLIFSHLQPAEATALPTTASPSKPIAGRRATPLLRRSAARAELASTFALSTTHSPYLRRPSCSRSRPPAGHGLTVPTPSATPSHLHQGTPRLRYVGLCYSATTTLSLHHPSTPPSPYSHASAM